MRQFCVKKGNTYHLTVKYVRQISVGDLAALAERWNLEHGANFYFLFFSAFWGRIEKY